MTYEILVPHRKETRFLGIIKDEFNVVVLY